jgi:hypothetical protein
MIEKIMTETLRQYMNLDEAIIDRILIDPNFFVKELVQRIDNLEVLIFSNDHNPPHFHVKSKDRKIDAKFYIATGDYWKGDISSSDIKRVKAFYNSPKGKIILELIWNKRNQ